MIPVNLSKHEVFDFCYSEIMWANSKAVEFPEAAKEVIASIMELIYKKGQFDSSETMKKYLLELSAKKNVTHTEIVDELKQVEEAENGSN